MPTTVTALTGVYDADGSLRGEISYAVGKVLGRRHCALCDITHGTVRPKASWLECHDSVDVPFEVVHLDERTPEIAAVSTGSTPCVLAHTDDGALVVLLGPSELEACGKDPVQLMRAIEDELARRGWSWPT